MEMMPHNLSFYRTLIKQLSCGIVFMFGTGDEMNVGPEDLDSVKTTSSECPAVDRKTVCKGS